MTQDIVSEETGYIVRYDGGTLLRPLNEVISTVHRLRPFLYEDAARRFSHEAAKRDITFEDRQPYKAADPNKPIRAGNDPYFWAGRVDMTLFIHKPSTELTTKPTLVQTTILFPSTRACDGRVERSAELYATKPLPRKTFEQIIDELAWSIALTHGKN